MEAFTWTSAVALIGSVGTVCATLYALLKRKPSGDSDEVKLLRQNVDDLKSENAQLRERIAANETLSADNKEELQRLRDGFEKLNDLLIQLLSEK